TRSTGPWPQSKGDDSMTETYDPLRQPLAAEQTITSPVAIAFDIRDFATWWLPYIEFAVKVVGKDRADLRKCIGELGDDMAGNFTIDLETLAEKLEDLAHVARVAKARCEVALAE